MSSLFALALAILGAALLYFALNFSVSSIFEAAVRQICLSLGFLSITVGFGWLYTKALEETRLKASQQTLKILDWSLICLCLVLLPMFETLGLIPIFWVVLLVLPCFAARYFIAWWIRNRI